MDIQSSIKTFLTRKRIYLSAGILAFLLLIFSQWAFNKVEYTTQKLIFSSVDEIPYTKTALLLGTSPTLKNGKANPYFTNRIASTAHLYHSGKITNILISGDNGSKQYDEPTAMKMALIGLGVPDSVIFLDYAGFRTIDSVIRSKEIFGRDSITIISQGFHNKRAVYIAKHHGIYAVAYNAEDIGGKSGLRQNIRERGARVKLMWDLYAVHYTPHFLGEKEVMP